ncbi:CotH kinase family protein [Romboutsia sp.]|uniref:CotH kinase family protein n=1 Tax=Romboutsia sp. TaxID=1965302 RepID=UPI003F3BC5DE
MSVRKKVFISAIILTISSYMLVGCSKDTETKTTTSIDTSYNNFFKENEVKDIHIEISEKDWKDMLDNASDEKYHSANITVNDTTLKNIGIRTKGFSSLKSVSSSDSERYSFRIKLDKYVDGQNLNGLGEFVLNNNFQDPSYMREYLSYKALEKLGVNVPKTIYSKVYINGELFGFYLAVEAVDDSFIDRISDDDAKDVKLYKADGENSTLVDEKSLSGFKLSNGKDDNMAGLKKLVTAINSIKDGNKGDIESVFDVESFLKSIAVNTVLGNYDSYSGSKAHNYFLLEEDGVFKYIPWDYNMAFGGFMEDQGASVTVSIDEPIYNVDSSKRPLIEKLLSVKEYKEKYYGYIKELVKYYDNFEEQVNEVATLIRPYVKNDPSAFYTIEQFEKNIVASGNPPQMPNGDKAPENGDTTKQTEDGKTPNKGGGMNLSGDVVSIMDYLQQRIKNIKSQLK